MKGKKERKSNIVPEEWISLAWKNYYLVVSMFVRTVLIATETKT